METEAFRLNWRGKRSAANAMTTDATKNTHPFVHNQNANNKIQRNHRIFKIKAKQNVFRKTEQNDIVCIYTVTVNSPDSVMLAVFDFR